MVYIIVQFFISTYKGKTLFLIFVILTAIIYIE